MNAGLLTNTFVANVGGSPAPSQSAAIKNTRQFAPAAPENPTPANPADTKTTDNIHTDDKGTPVREPQEFRHAFREKTMLETSQKGQAETELKGQGSTFAVAPQPNIVQGWLTQHPLLKHGRKGLAREMEPKAGYELAQLLASLNAHKFYPATGPTAKPVEKTPLLTINKGQLGLKTVPPGTSKGPLSTDAQPEEGKNAGAVQISNKTPIATKTLINQESSEELMAKATTAESKTTNDGGKTAIVGEKPAMSAKPVVSSSTQKTPVLNDNSPTVEDKPSESEPKILVGPEKSVTVAEKPTDNKAASQQGRVPISKNATKWGAGQISSESSSWDGKEQTGNLSGNLLLQKLNVTELQVSTEQTKDGNNSTSNNSSNSNFEQIPSHNSTQTLITEQSFVSSQAAKIANTNNASSSDVSAGISEQIQGSIYSLLRRGDQQITIRLNPPELGKVFLRFQEQQNQIIGLLEVSKIQTRVEIQQALPQIIHNLQDSGIQIKRLEVVLTDKAEQQPYRDQSLQDGSFQQHGSTEGNHSNNTSANEWLTSNGSSSGFLEPQKMLITDSSVNMLI